MSAVRKAQKGCTNLFKSPQIRNLNQQGNGNKWCSSVTDSYPLALESQFIRFTLYYLYFNSEGLFRANFLLQ